MNTGVSMNLQAREFQEKLIQSGVLAPTPDNNQPWMFEPTDDGMRVYLDADIQCAPQMLPRLRAALDRPEARYAGGELVVTPAKSWVTRRYADLWSRLPFMKKGVTGAGLFAVNAAGRARWDKFPEIISDDGFVRLCFAPGERIKVSASYLWPLSEGFSRLVRVRRRQNAGM